MLVTVATTATAASETLSATVLLGKQLFYDARDTRLAKDGYMSCASCHNDGGQDGRVWDLTGFGEGLRNTIALAGRAGMGHGFVHWSANFDEIQDFEKQIRNLAGGTGLMTDAQFNTGTRNQPLGDKKAGVSADLDALAAYLGSLGRFASTPYRNADSSLTTAAVAGKTTFNSAGCGTCHGGAPFTISATATAMRNIGTIQSSSGSRLGAALTGIDVPSLRDVWATAPYLHNGSAATLSAAIGAHSGVTLSATDLSNVVAYVQQIGAEELGALGIWRFDEGSGNTAADASTSNRPMTLTNTTWIGGKTGRAIRLNGTNAVGSTSAAAVVDTSGSFTVAAWLRLDSLTGWRTAVNQDGTNVSGFWLQYSEAMGKKFSFTMHDSDATTSTAFRALSTTLPAAGVWYHVAGVRDRAAGTMKIYVNGVLEGTTAYTGGWAANGALNVGRGRFGGPGDWFAGAVDDVQAYTGVLTDADIAALALQGKAPSQGAWKFDEGTGTTVADASGAFHPLTLSNATWVDARLNKGVQFNGTTTVGTTTAPVVDTSGTFSIASWVRVDSLTGARTFVNQDGVNVSGFWLQFSQSLGNKFAFAMQASDATTATMFRATGTTTPVVGQWYHVVAVRDKAAGTMKLFVNGALEATTTHTGGWAANGALNVGRGRSGSANDWFSGALDDLDDRSHRAQHHRGRHALRAGAGPAARQLEVQRDVGHRGQRRERPGQEPDGGQRDVGCREERECAAAQRDQLCGDVDGRSAQHDRQLLGRGLGAAQLVDRVAHGHQSGRHERQRLLAAVRSIAGEQVLVHHAQQRCHQQHRDARSVHDRGHDGHLVSPGGGARQAGRDHEAVRERPVGGDDQLHRWLDVQREPGRRPRQVDQLERLVLGRRG